MKTLTPYLKRYLILILTVPFFFFFGFQNDCDDQSCESDCESRCDRAAEKGTVSFIPIFQDQSILPCDVTNVTLEEVLDQFGPDAIVVEEEEMAGQFGFEFEQDKFTVRGTISGICDDGRMFFYDFNKENTKAVLRIIGGQRVGVIEVSDIPLGLPIGISLDVTKPCDDEPGDCLDCGMSNDVTWTHNYVGFGSATLSNDDIIEVDVLKQQLFCDLCN